MGSFNITGFASNLPILPRDKVVCFIGICNNVRYTDVLRINNSLQCAPISFPIYAEYCDCGFVENIEKDSNTEFIESYFNNMSIEDILMNASNSDNEFSELILRKLKIFNSDKSICLMVEHRDVFESMVNISKRTVQKQYYALNQFVLSDLGFTKSSNGISLKDIKYVFPNGSTEYFVTLCYQGGLIEIVDKKTLSPIKFLFPNNDYGTTFVHTIEELKFAYRQLFNDELKVSNEWNNEIYYEYLFKKSCEALNDFNKKNEDLLHEDEKEDTKIRKMILESQFYSFINSFENEIVCLNRTTYSVLLDRENKDWLSLYGEDNKMLIDRVNDDKFVKLVSDFINFKNTMNILSLEYTPSASFHQEPFYSEFVEFEKAKFELIQKKRQKYLDIMN